MAKVITLGLQKGGVSKTTTTGVLAHFLAQDGYKVLAVDMDSQGNLTELLTDMESNEFIDNSVFEAMAFKQPKLYIHQINEQMDILPANNFLASFGRWLYLNELPNVGQKVKYNGPGYDQLNQMLNQIRDIYDFIVIDTPPALSEQTTNALVASDYVIVLYESSKFCHSAIPNLMETIEYIQMNIQPNLKKLGILRTLNDKRKNDSKLFNREIADEYPDLVFDTIIDKKATTGRLSLYGFQDNHELKDSVAQFKDFYQEFLNRLEEDEEYGKQHG